MSLELLRVPLTLDISPPATSSSNISVDQHKCIGEYLEDLAKTILDVCINQNNQKHPIIQKHQSPDFRNQHDAIPGASNQKDHHENLRKHLAQQGSVNVQIHNTSFTLDNSRGRATVWVWYQITGLAYDIQREAVARFSFERKDEVWMLMKHVGMRGPAGFWIPP